MNEDLKNTPSNFVNLPTKKIRTMISDYCASCREYSDQFFFKINDVFFFSVVIVESEQKTRR